MKQRAAHSRLKILHITPSLITGGAERALVRLIQSSDKNRFHHHVVSLTDFGTQGAELGKTGIAVDALRISGPFSAPKGILRLRNITKSVKPVVICGWMYHGGLFALFAGSKASKVTAIRHSLHDLEKDKKTTRALIFLLARFSKRFNSVIFNSEASKKQHQAIGYNANKNIFIPNGFDTNEFSPYSLQDKTRLRARLKLPENDFVFGYVARHHPVKNHSGLLKTFSEVIKHWTNVKLVLIGQGLSSNNFDLIEPISQLGLTKHVILLGERNDIPELLQALDAYVSPSHAEAFPNTIGEAMSCGIPCIATDVGDSAAIIGDTGIVVPQNNNEALAKAMLGMVQMPKEERKALGRKARQRIIDKFRLEVVTKQYEELYLRLSENHSQ